MNSRDFVAPEDALSSFLPGAVFRYRVGADGVGRLEHMTPACYEIWELDRAAIEQDMASLWAMVDPEDLPDMRQSVIDCAQDLRDWDHQWRITTRSGRRKWLHGMGRPRREPDGSLLWHVLVVDQSNNRVAQEATRISDQRFRHLIEAIPNVAVQGYDDQLICRFWNAASERLYGYTQAEALGQNLLDLIIPPGMRQLVIQATDAMLATGDAIPSEELTLRHKNGTDVHVYSGHVLLHQTPGGPAEFFCIDFDLSERLAAESARRTLEAQLREAQKMEALGTLAGGIAHDFNNILAAVLGNASLALEIGPAQGELRECVEQIQKAAQRARSVVRQILAFARKESPQRTPMDLLAVAQEACSLLKATAPPGVVVALSANQPLPLVMADGTQMEQVVLNLGTNAVYAVTGRLNGQVQITLAPAARAAVRAVPGHWVLDQPADDNCPGLWIRVQDNGGGIPPATAQRIFEPFFTTKDRGQGTGLGLSVVHGILKEHGASLKLHSCPEIGTTFDIWMAQANQAAHALAPQDPAGARPQRPSRRLLYVDDDPQIVDLVARTCARAGHQVQTMSDPHQALDYLARHGAELDLAVLDHNMPQMAGLTLLTKARQHQPGLRFAVVSSIVDDALRAQAMRLGASLVVEKTETLVDSIVSALDTLPESTRP